MLTNALHIVNLQSMCFSAFVSLVYEYISSLLVNNALSNVNIHTYI